MTSYELSFDNSTIFKALLIIPATSLAFYCVNLMITFMGSNYNNKIEPIARNKERSNDQKTESVITHKVISLIHETSRTDVLDLLDILQDNDSDYCNVQFVKDNHSFCLINDTNLINAISNHEPKCELFESQLNQPYLVMDSKCNLKMTKCEYDKVIKPVLKSHFENINEIFTTDTLPTEFDNFLETNKDLSRKSIFELVFRISTAYIKKILDLPVNNSILSSGEKLILYNLYEIHQSFTLGLFTNNNQVLVNNYSSSYKELMELIEQEFNIQTNSKNMDINENEQDSELIKFLLIKSIYLDSLKLYSCITWFLAIVSQSDSEDTESLITAIKKSESTAISDLTSEYSSNNLKKHLLKSYFKTFTLDLYYMNTKGTIPAELKFLRPNQLIALNLFNVVETMQSDDDEFTKSFSCLDDLFQMISKSIGIFFIRNFNLNESLAFLTSDNDVEEYDLPLIRCFDSC